MNTGYQKVRTWVQDEVQFQWMKLTPAPPQWLQLPCIRHARFENVGCFAVLALQAQTCDCIKAPSRRRLWQGTVVPTTFTATRRMGSKADASMPGASSSSDGPIDMFDNSASPYADAPPSYDSIQTADPASKGPWSAQDPRSSSQQSLVPSESNQQNERRKLLLVYIHGFMGNETSFRSFPAHVHNLLTVLIAETHVVHTKLYPRYRSKRNISFARDDFSRWLEPHEDDKTDVVLLGHSMGGLLSAEVVLMPPEAPARRPLKHRILGTINFDVPFLGMHPGVVKSGLASIFQSDEGQGDKWSAGDMQSGVSSSNQATASASSPSRTDTLWTPGQQDPNFNPSFENDVVLPMRKGWQNAWHFLSKHSNDLGKATKQLVTSHLEFGGAMANYAELKTRYGRVRALEEENETVRTSVVKGSEIPPRVRFINYYTASTGRIRKPKSPQRELSPNGDKGQKNLSPANLGDTARGRSEQSEVANQPGLSRSQSPRISLQEHSDEGVVPKHVDMPPDDEGWEAAAESLTIDESSKAEPERTNTDQSRDADSVLSPTSTLSTTASLPPVPDLPTKPAPLDVTYIQDTDTRKLVEKEHARAMKSYEKAIKDREKLIKDRAKLEEKRNRRAQKDAEKAAKDAEKTKQKAEKDALKLNKTKENAKQKKPESEMTQSEKEELRLENERKRMEAEGRRMRGEPEPEPDSNHEPEELEKDALEPLSDSEFVGTETAPALLQISSPEPSRSPSPAPQQPEEVQEKAKPKKDRKFCTLPPKDSTGQRDPCWVRVYMENVDEVGAHCGLFFVDERYERLVGDVADRIEGWVREEGDERAVGGFVSGGKR